MPRFNWNIVKKTRIKSIKSKFIIFQSFFSSLFKKKEKEMVLYEEFKHNHKMSKWVWMQQYIWHWITVDLISKTWKSHSKWQSSCYHCLVFSAIFRTISQLFWTLDILILQNKTQYVYIVGKYKIHLHSLWNMAEVRFVFLPVSKPLQIILYTMYVYCLFIIQY